MQTCDLAKRMRKLTWPLHDYWALPRASRKLLLDKADGVIQRGHMHVCCIMLSMCCPDWPGGRADALKWLLGCVIMGCGSDNAFESEG